MQCTYKCTMKLDTLGTDTKTDRMILRIGQNISQFYSYTAYRTDSIWKTPNGKRIWGDAMVRAIRSKNYDQMPNANMISNDYIYKNYPEGKLSTYAPLGVTSVLIEEDYTGQDWTLKDSTKTLLGYPCQLATCSYHGRDYQAWFTSEIAIDNGPWKFKGLPGLILEVYDTKDHYHFSIEGIERTNIAPVCFYYTLPDPRDAGRRHSRRPRLHTENRIKRRQKERQAEERSRSIHRLRLYGNRLSRTLRNYFIFHRKQRTRRNKKRYAFASLRLIFLMHSMPWNTFNQLISEQ